jgi:tyrosinase
MISRRRFVQSSMAAALVPLLPRTALTTVSPAASSGTLAIRPSWEEFAQGPYLQAYIDAIGAMRANKDETDPASWYYWVKTHQDYCPHGSPYFLAWHRGLLKRFEGQLRRVSGVSDIRLPYWNYYANPSIPQEFLMEYSPLWRSDRVSTDVSGALSLRAFQDDVVNFPRGSGNAFEAKLEIAPHNTVHDTIGGAMSNITFSPADPLFYLHHANIDRLWVAWVAAGNGRQMPPEDDVYWQGTPFYYGAAVREVPRVWTYSTTNTYLAYAYDDQTMPTTLPGSPTTTVERPTSEPVQTLPPADIDAHTKRLAGTGAFALDRQSTTFDVPLAAESAARVRSMMIRHAADGAGDPLELVLENVRLTRLGEEGGFFYKIFLNLPEQGASSRQESDYLLGVIGPFEISVEQMRARMAMGSHKGMPAGKPVRTTMRFPISEALCRIWPVTLDTLSISLVRVGRRERPGQVISVGRMELQASNTK